MSDMVVVRTNNRPELIPVVAGWLWHEFWRVDGYHLDQVKAFVTGARAEIGPDQCFVLLERDVPIGTASLASEDLAERPHLAPWLAGVYVVPEMRGRGLVQHLLNAVEDAARAADHAALWLYTSTAEPVYLRAGWHTVETVERIGKNPVALMRRSLK